MDVQSMVDGSVATAPRAQLVDRCGQPVIQVRRTVELHDPLSSLTAPGVKKLGYRFRFFDDGGATWEFTARRGDGRDTSALTVIKAARQRLGELPEAAIREAAEGVIGVDKDVRNDCEAIFRSRTGSWQLFGRETVYAVDLQVFVALASPSTEEKAPSSPVPHGAVPRRGGRHSGLFPIRHIGNL